MKEKLIIKNFGPIKEVKLTLSKINIFIGEQGTGKSAVSRLLNLLRFDYFIKDLYNKKIEIIDWLRDYDVIQYFTNETKVYYETKYFSIELDQKNIKLDILHQEFEQLLIKEQFLFTELGKIDIPTEKIKHQNISDSISDNDKLLGKYIGEVSFIPTERIMLSYLVEAAFSLNKVIEALPEYIKNAGMTLEYFKIFFEKEKLNIDLKNILDQDVLFYYENNIPRIKKRNQDFTLTQAESGIQSLIPLLAQFEMYKHYGRSWTYIVEEPELNLFPNTQYNLIKYLIASIIKREDRSMIITTHSPYILTSLNNLMYAYKVGQKHKEEAKKIIEEKYWVNPDDVSAYQLLSDGTCRDILDRDESLIEADKIDEVSRIINQQFNNLMNIEFEKA